MIEAQRSVRTTCPYCGVGCQIDLKIKDKHIVRVEAPFDIAPNFGRLCAKGRFGIDFVHHPSRLTHPLIRVDLETRPRKPVGLEGFRPATWDEALELSAEKMTEIVEQYGGDAIGTFCSASISASSNPPQLDFKALTHYCPLFSLPDRAESRFLVIGCLLDQARGLVFTNFGFRGERALTKGFNSIGSRHSCVIYHSEWGL